MNLFLPQCSYDLFRKMLCKPISLPFQEFCLDLYQPQGVGRRKRSNSEEQDDEIKDSILVKDVVSPIRSKRSDGYEKDRQQTTLSLAEGGRGKGEAVFMRKDKIATEKPRRNFYPIPLDSNYYGKRENDRQLPNDNDTHEEADINENVSFTVIIPEGNINPLKSYYPRC